MLVDDNNAMLRLTGRPELILRADELLRLHNPKELPALVVQARPAPGVQVALDVWDTAVQGRFLAGAGGQAAWWDSFRSGQRAKPVFHGVASLPSGNQPTWACEAHGDGHFVAGLWRFPGLPWNGRDVPVLADFHRQYFIDFLTVVERTLHLGGTQHKYELTAAVVGASGLHFAKKSDFGGNHSVAGGPLSVQILQFRVFEAVVGAPTWMATAELLARALCGAYGATP